MAAPRPAAPPPTAASTGVPRSWLAGLAALITVPWLVVAGIYFGAQGDQPPGTVAAPATPESAGARGPWGRLTSTPILISPPLEYVPEDWGRKAPAEWMFPDTTAEAVATILSSAGLSPAQLEQLIPGARDEPRINGVVITPPPDLVRALSLEARTQLYTRLSKSTLNFDQAQSFRFLGRTTSDWFDGTMMSAATRQLVEPMVYKSGDFLHFADIESVRSLLTSPRERQYLAKALLRNATVMIRLHVDSSEEVAGLSSYWGIGGRRTDIRPLLESLASAGDDRTIDVAHLLPAFARDHLYRYPKVQTVDMTRSLLANCLWSSLNFFEATPDERYLDVNVALGVLRTRYYIVENEYQLGDIVALVDDEGDLFHVAVYLAAGWVFTKNGTSAVAPWTIMSVEHLKQFYRSRAENPRLIVHRPSAY